VPSRTGAIDEFLARLDAAETQAFNSYLDRRQRSAESLCRRIHQALVDLDLDHLQDWAQAKEGAVSFCDLEAQPAERLAHLLEILAARARRGC
jgi:hypothetical protein